MSLFDEVPEQPTSVFSGAHEEAQPTFDLAAIKQQLMEQTGCSEQEAVDAIARQVAKRAAPKHNPILEVPFSQLRTDKERAEYMRAHSAKVAAEFNNDPYLKALAETDILSDEAEKQAMARMKERGTSQGMMRSVQAATDFFKKARTGE